MDNDKSHDLGWKPTISILGGVGWLIFIIMWLAFYASNYSWEKNFAIFLLSVLILVLLLGGIWLIWSLKMIPKHGWEMLKIKGFKWRILTSLIIPLLALLFLIVWFWYYASPYTIWQNIAVLLVVLLVIGGILGSIWTRWTTKHGHEMKKFEDISEEIGRKFEDAFQGTKEDETEK